MSELLEGIEGFLGKGRWVPLSRVAEMAGQPVRACREKLQRVDARAGNTILRRRGKSKHAPLEVDLEALRMYYQSDESLRNAELDTLKSELADTKRKLEALRSAYLDLRNLLSGSARGMHT